MRSTLETGGSKEKKEFGDKVEAVNFDQMNGDVNDETPGDGGPGPLSSPNKAQGVDPDAMDR